MTSTGTSSSNGRTMKILVERVIMNDNSATSSSLNTTIPDHWDVPKNSSSSTSSPTTVVIPPEKFKDPWIGVNHDKSVLDGMSMMKDFLFNSPSIPSDEELPQLKPNWDKLMNPSESSDEYQVTWIGHSTFLIQYRGVNIITDPVFSERCSPSQYFGPKRIKPIPFPDISKLPKIHFVIISHNHYDHLDEHAFKEIQKHHDPIFLLPFKMKYKWMMKHYSNSDAEKEKLVDLDWWKETTFKVTAENQTVSNLSFVCLPAQHWSSRTGFDRNHVLWGSWGFKFDYTDGNENVTRSFWHAGDTGYK
ncbi:predicted protein [Naegleria gruberi]|uniref:Predicted protein n=1 Tax=Naegleria gruberi TaxID=5762 RepID=D2W1D1_NAEGR|nr:uncharacterized protein NAEGRDRAFT_75174 [Naegleria gruberi]EFC37164.1 predicted protein [Naegleria gruberi]|eukprot:XP_002669908.1 predicted protein [Naegleria gruberi strain NEG-M]